MKIKYLVLFTLVFSALFLVACGGGAPAAEEPQIASLSVMTHDIYFGDTADNQENPPVWTVPAGGTATVNFKNMGTLEHNWAVIKLGQEIPVPFVMENDKDLILYDTGLVPAGEERNFTFRVPNEPGEYTVICTQAGHYPSMQGRLIVN